MPKSWGKVWEVHICQGIFWLWLSNNETGTLVDWQVHQNLCFIEWFWKASLWLYFLVHWQLNSLRVLSPKVGCLLSQSRKLLFQSQSWKIQGNLQCGMNVFPSLFGMRILMIIFLSIFFIPLYFINSVLSIVFADEAKLFFPLSLPSLIYIILRSVFISLLFFSLQGQAEFTFPQLKKKIIWSSSVFQSKIFSFLDFTYFWFHRYIWYLEGVCFSLILWWQKLEYETVADINGFFLLLSWTTPTIPII